MSWASLANSIDSISSTRHRSRASELDSERQSLLDQHSIRMQLQQDSRAQNQEARTQELHGTTVENNKSIADTNRIASETAETNQNLQTYSRMAQIKNQHLLNPETGQLDFNHGEPMQRVVEGYNAAMRADPNARRIISGMVNERTDGKYDEFDFEYLPNQGVAIRMRNTISGEDGVVTDGGTTDPNDTVTILEGEEFTGLMEHFAAMSGANLPDGVIASFVGGSATTGVDDRIASTDPEQLASVAQQIISQNEDIPEEDVISLALDVIQQGRASSQPPVGEPPVQDTTGNSRQPENRNSVPAAQLGAQGRAERFDARNGVETPEAYVNPPPASEENLSAEERGAVVGRRMQDFGQRERDARANSPTDKALSDAAKKVGKGLSHARSFMAGVFNPDAASDSKEPKVDTSIPVASRLSEDEINNPEQFGEALERNAQALQNGEIRPNATHQAGTRRTIENPDAASPQERAQSAMYLFASGYLSFEDAHTLKDTGYMNTTVANLMSRNDQTAANLAIAGQKQLRDDVKNLQERNLPLHKNVNKQAQTFMSELDIDMSRAPQIERSWLAVLETVTGMQLPNTRFNPASSQNPGADIASRNRTYDTLESMNSNATVQGAFRSAHVQFQWLKDNDRSFRRADPDMEIAVQALTVAGLRQMGLDTIRDEKEKGNAANLFYNLTRDYGGGAGRVGGPEAVNAAMAITGALHRDAGLPYGRITVAMVDEHMDMWPEFLQASGNNVEDASKLMSEHVGKSRQ